LTGVLIRARRGAPFIGQSIPIAAVATVYVLVILEALLPSPYYFFFHDQGLLAAIVGGMCGAVLLRSARREGSQRPPSNIPRLAALTFISGPLIGLILAWLKILGTDESQPSDGINPFGLFIPIGVVAGLIAAGSVAVASASGSWRASVSAEKDLLPLKSLVVGSLRYAQPAKINTIETTMDTAEMISWPGINRSWGSSAFHRALNTVRLRTRARTRLRMGAATESDSAEDEGKAQPTQAPNPACIFTQPAPAPPISHNGIRHAAPRNAADRLAGSPPPLEGIPTPQLINKATNQPEAVAVTDNRFGTIFVLEWITAAAIIQPKQTHIGHISMLNNFMPSSPWTVRLPVYFRPTHSANK
ncbi:MAG: hypothetical protein N2C14_22810, partial [Planctomycetales bacterium]